MGADGPRQPRWWGRCFDSHFGRRHLSLAHAKSTVLTMHPDARNQSSCRPDWLHEIKRDGYRLLVQRGERVRLFTRNGHDWTARYPLIIEAAPRNRCSSFVVDGEAVLLGVDGISRKRLSDRWRRFCGGPEPDPAEQAAFSSQIVGGSILRNNRAAPPVVDAGGDNIDVLLDPIAT